jgi:hypothetical protein
MTQRIIVMSGKPNKTDPFDPEKHVLIDTSYGRAHLPEVLQASLGEKSIVGFDRYDRVVGAMVPIEAVRILAGYPDHVDPDVQERIRRAALKLLMTSAPEKRRLDPAAPTDDREPVSLVDIEAERNAAQPQKRQRT